jgi:hypothetical protein
MQVGEDLSRNFMLFKPSKEKQNVVNYKNVVPYFL